VVPLVRTTELAAAPSMETFAVPMSGPLVAIQSSWSPAKVIERVAKLCVALFSLPPEAPDADTLDQVPE
jgi:hypothetical protein